MYTYHILYIYIFNWIHGINQKLVPGNTHLTARGMVTWNIQPGKDQGPTTCNNQTWLAGKSPIKIL